MKQVQLEVGDWDRLLYLADLAVGEILTDMDAEEGSADDPEVAWALLDKVRKQVV